MPNKTIADHGAGRRASIAQVVANLAKELRRAGLWESREPSADALASAQPFSCDTLSFHQWLQWRFIPQMNAILENEQRLPRCSAIHPYAEECLADATASPEALLFLLRSFDELISGQDQQVFNDPQ